MHDYSVFFIILWGYFFIPVLIIFLVIWYFTKGNEITHKIKLWRVLPFSILLSPASLPDSIDMPGIALPSIIAIVVGDPLEKLLYLFIILVYTAIGWMLYWYVAKSNEDLHFKKMNYQQKILSKSDEEKLAKIKEIDRNL